MQFNFRLNTKIRKDHKFLKSFLDFHKFLIKITDERIFQDFFNTFLKNLNVIFGWKKAEPLLKTFRIEKFIGKCVKELLLFLVKSEKKKQLSLQKWKKSLPN